MTSTCPYYCYRKTKQPTVPTRTKPDIIELVIFDMDGVLTDTLSSWRTIHEYFHTSNQRSVDAYLKGKIDDLEFIKRDIALWEEHGIPTTLATLNTILSTIPFMKGVQDCIAFLRNHGIKTAIVSAGLDMLAGRIAHDLGIDYVAANGVKTDKKGRLTGEGILRVRLIHKDESVRKLSEDYNIPLERCVAIGNSCFDIPMFEVCGRGIAFNPEDDCVRKAADIVVEGKDLRTLIPVFRPFVR